MNMPKLLVSHWRVFSLPTMLLLACNGSIKTAVYHDGGNVDSSSQTETGTGSDNGECFDEIGITESDLGAYFGGNDTALGGDYIQLYAYSEVGGVARAIEISFLAAEGAPTTAGSYLMTSPNPSECSICIRLYVMGIGSSPSPLTYVPVASSGFLVIDTMPSSLGLGAVSQPFKGHFTLDLHQIDSETHEVVEDGCYLSAAYFDWDIVLTAPPGD